MFNRLVWGRRMWLFVFSHHYQKAWIHSVSVILESQLVSFVSMSDTRLSTLVSPTTELNSNLSPAPNERALLVLREGAVSS